MSPVPSTASAQRPLRRVDRGEAGRVLRELHAKDFVFTVLETQTPTAHYRRVRFAGNGFLQRYRPYPTMWVRLWFTDLSGAGHGHQRAFTLVDPNVESDTFWLEFALHEGAAAQWAINARAGDEVEASLYGSEPALPDRIDVDTHLLVGDTASLPAINSLLDAMSEAPSVVVIEWVHHDDLTLPVRLRSSDRLRWVRRQGDGQALLDAAQEELDAVLSSARADTSAEGVPTLPRTTPRVFAWGACDTVTTRKLTKMLKAAGLRREDIKTLGYWLPSRDDATALAG